MAKLASFYSYSLSHIGVLEAPYGVFITLTLIDLLNSFGVGFTALLGEGEHHMRARAAYLSGLGTTRLWFMGSTPYLLIFQGKFF